MTSGWRPRARLPPAMILGAGSTFCRAPALLDLRFLRERWPWDYRVEVDPVHLQDPGGLARRMLYLSPQVRV
jgi:hypothetical protein